MYLINLGIKVLLVFAFGGIIYYIIDYILSLANISSYIDTSSNVFALLNLFGVMKALNLYVSIIMAGFFTKQLLSFFKS